MTSQPQGWASHLWAWRTALILLLSPLLLLPVAVVIDSSEGRCAYVVILMSIYWVTEALPVGVTALLPVLLFPTLGIADTAAVTGKYFNNVNMLMAAGLMMAICIEYWNLHRRIAIKILLLVGSEPRWLMAGMMLATWFLSMWISNTATTAMMIPITEAILVQLKRERKPRVAQESEGVTSFRTEENNTKDEADQRDVKVSVTPDPEDDDDEDDPAFTRMCKGMSLCICYAANSGGIASLTGTGPNLVLKAESDAIYSQISDSNPVSFGTWMMFGLPLSATVLVVCWLWLQLAFLRCRFGGASEDAKDQKERVKAVIKAEYEKLGPVVFGQAMTTVLFVMLVLLWITRDLGGVVGWGNWFDMSVKDSVPAVLIAVLLFAVPSTLPCLASYTNYDHPQKKCLAEGTRKGQKDELIIRPLLNWKIVNEKMPWQLFLLLGGGFALSLGCQESGLSRWIGDQLSFFASWNEFLMLLIICYITSAFTEVTSNTAISQLFMPVMSQLALKTGRHPLLFMFPVALSCSFAFMLPVATPPNALVFAYGRLVITDMVKAGFVMNLLAVPILVAFTQTLGDAIFDFGSVPDGFLNVTIPGSVDA